MAAAPEEVTESALMVRLPAPLCVAQIPFLPVTVAASIVALVVAVPVVSSMPAPLACVKEPVTAPVASMVTAPPPSASATMPSRPPVTEATSIESAPPLDPTVASTPIPAAAAPVTEPVALTDTTPLPSTLMPCAPPVTDAAVTVTPPPEIHIPCPDSPVTAPVASTEIAPRRPG